MFPDIRFGPLMVRRVGKHLTLEGADNEVCPPVKCPAGNYDLLTSHYTLHTIPPCLLTSQVNGIPANKYEDNNVT